MVRFSVIIILSFIDLFSEFQSGEFLFHFCNWLLSWEISGIIWKFLQQNVTSCEKVLKTIHTCYFAWKLLPAAGTSLALHETQLHREKRN